jgi:hypothetical protein
VRRKSGESRRFDSLIGLCHEDVTSRPSGTDSVVLINYYVQYLGDSRRCVPNRTLPTIVYILMCGFIRLPVNLRDRLG